MAEENIDIETLKARGLTCERMKQLEERQFKDAKLFRDVGFIGIANVEEQTALKIKGLRKKVCLLR